MIKISITGGGVAFDVNETLVKPVVLELSQAVYDAAQQGADRHTKTGALLQSLYNRATPTGRTVGHDRKRAKHAVFVLLGTRPHLITPKGKKALRWAGGSNFIFAKKVHHPGYKGDHYLNRAAQLAASRFLEIVNKHWGDK